MVDRQRSASAFVTGISPFEKLHGHVLQSMHHVPLTTYTISRLYVTVLEYVGDKLLYMSFIML